VSPGGGCRPTRRARGRTSAAKGSHAMPVHIDRSVGPSVGLVVTARALGVLVGAVLGSIGTRLGPNLGIPLPHKRLRASRAGCSVTEEASSEAGKASSEAEQASSVTGQASSEAGQASSEAEETSSEAEQASSVAGQAFSVAEKASSEAEQASSAMGQRPTATVRPCSAPAGPPRTPEHSSPRWRRLGEDPAPRPFGAAAHTHSP